jgi:hypothetical protein
MANESPLKFFREGLIFEILAPKSLLGVAAGKTASKTSYVGLLDSFFLKFLDLSRRRLRSDFIINPSNLIIVHDWEN